MRDGGNQPPVREEAQGPQSHFYFDSVSLEMVRSTPATRSSCIYIHVLEQESQCISYSVLAICMYYLFARFSFSLLVVHI